MFVFEMESELSEEQDIFRPHGHTVLTILAYYLPYQAFGELLSVSSSFREELTNFDEKDWSWFKRIQEEYNTDISQDSWAGNWKLVYKTLHELEFNPKQGENKTYSVFDSRRESFRNKNRIATKADFQRNEVDRETCENIKNFLLGKNNRYSHNYLRWAITSNYKHLVRLLLIYLQQRFPEQMSLILSTSLNTASANGCMSILQFLLSLNIEIPEQSYTNALMSAVTKGNLETTKILLSNPHVHPSINGNKALTEAFSKGYVAIIDLLLKQPSVRKSFRLSQISESLEELVSGRRRRELEELEEVFMINGIDIEYF